MNRTLVLPPAQRMYLLAKDRDKHKTHFGFADFFPLDKLKEQQIVDIISMQDFLLLQSGKMLDKTTGKVSWPPNNNRTDWEGASNDEIKLLKEWLRNTTVTPLWTPKCLAAFPATNDPLDIKQLQEIHAELLPLSKNNNAEYLEHPVPVDAPPRERMKENLNGKQELCIYNDEMQAAPTLHFMCYHKMKGANIVSTLFSLSPGRLVSHYQLKCAC
jgi:hypothetical protein